MMLIYLFISNIHFKDELHIYIMYLEISRFLEENPDNRDLLILIFAMKNHLQFFIFHKREKKHK